MKAATKVGIGVPEYIAQFVQQYQESHELLSRSGVFVEAARLLRERELAQAYQAASQVWDNSEEARLWEQTVGDGGQANKVRP
jgi:hypothetical protein